MKFDFGKLMLLGDRARFYVTWFQFGLIGYLTLKTTELDINLLYMSLPLFFLLMIFDWFVILPQNFNASANKNPFLVEMNERIKRIEEKLL